MAEGDPTPPREVPIDYRWVLANERTFLAWMRTALGVIAGGVALNQFVKLQDGTIFVQLVSIAVIAFGAVIAVFGMMRWQHTDQEMYSGRAMPRTKAFLYLGVIVALIAVAAVVIVAIS